MEWIEVKIKTTSEAVEVLTGLLMANNIPNLRIVDDESVSRFLLDHPLNWDYKDEMPPKIGAEVIFYVADEAVFARIEKKLKELPNILPEIKFGDMAISCGPVNEDDWLHEWKKTYKPFTIGKSVVVRPFWEEYIPRDGETVFTIDPGAVFGTGLHATTQLCVMALEKENLHGAKVLDIGCGSGILSVIALLLGAESAVACDIDPGASRMAQENARLNNIDTNRLEVHTGDVFTLEAISKSGEFDIVLANIVADVIIELAEVVPKLLKKGGRFIASGIIDERVGDVLAAYNQTYKIKEHTMDGWTCLSIF